MKLYENNPNYVRLDDDVSFQIVRTNPKLTTNTKLMYDGENLYMDSYDAASLLSTVKYKHHQVWKTGLFNRDIRNFLLGTNTTAYTVGRSAKNTVVLNSYDNQFENMYWCGAESINSDLYPQEMGFIAPLYIRKNRPNYFVIFRVDSPTNINVNKNDSGFNFYEDVKSKAHIVKSFDLREGTPIGDYIKRYVEQREFKYDQSIYVNFSSNDIYYYGIDKSKGVLTTKVENFEEQLLNNDNTILKSDSWITDGFERNNLIFPYIINFEFLFDDKEIGEYKFARYFGMYCNTIDLYDLDITDFDKSSNILTTDWRGVEDTIEMDPKSFYYIKDKFGGISSIRSTVDPSMFEIYGKIDINDFSGFEKSSVSTFATRLPGVGKSIMVLEIVKQLEDGDTVVMFNTTDSNSLINLGSFIATNQYGAGEFYNNRFSCKGNLRDIAKALSGAIKMCNTDEFKFITAFSVGSKVVIQASYPGTNMNKLFDVTFDRVTNFAKKIIKLTDSFDGGTDIDGCRFLVYTSDSEVFFDNSGQDRDTIRYIQTGLGRDNAKIIALVPYINEDNKIDDTYSVVVTDENGQYVNVSKTEQIEIVDRYYPKVGILSFYPVKDFDFDTVSSVYGDGSLMEKELEAIKEVDINYYDEENDETTVMRIKKDANIPYDKFYDSNNNAIKSEYDYYVENLIPELTTVNKTVPYVTKWGYMDDAKDSCENPYRLNTSKIFDTCNFSANTFMQRGDIMEYTHSMPYYVSNRSEYDSNGLKINNRESKEYSTSVNEYQYIPLNGQVWSDDYLSIKLYFSQKKIPGREDPFTAVFGDTSNTIFCSKRFNKKYSRFLLGDDKKNSSTLFRGVKFELTELENGKEINTGKYNGYRFAFVYVPVFKKVDDKIHFIKNDDYKFIVGIVFFNMKTKDTTQEFNKGYVYSGAMGYFDENDDEDTNV